MEKRIPRLHPNERKTGARRGPRVALALFRQFSASAALPGMTTSLSVRQKSIQRWRHCE